MERNFALVHEAAAALGDVPELLSAARLATHGPEERATLLYTAFLCRALLEASADDRAAVTLQRAWRSHCARRPGDDCASPASEVAHTASNYFTNGPGRMIITIGSPGHGSAAGFGCTQLSPCLRRAPPAVIDQTSLLVARQHLASTALTMLTGAKNADAGSARQHLQSWVAAARVISGVLRRRLDRRALIASTAAIRRGLAASLRIQALWRSRGPRRAYQRLLQAARRCQVRPSLKD